MKELRELDFLLILDVSSSPRRKAKMEEEVVSLQELITPFGQTLTTVFRLFVVGCTGFLQPFDEQLFVLFENQELTQNDISLVKALFIQSLSKHFSDTSQFSNRFVSHGFRHEVVMFLRCSRHLGCECE